MFGNAVILDFNPYEIRTEDGATHQVGEPVLVGDRIFRFATAGEALSAGYLCTEPTGNTNLITMAVISGVKGDNKINFTNASTTTTAGYFDSGYAVISYGTGIGHTIPIDHMDALVSAASSWVYLTQPLPVTLDTTSKLDIVANPWRRVLHTTGTALHPVGVPLVAVTAAGDFCWLQTRGVCGIFADGTITAGTQIINDATSAGAVDVASASVATPFPGRAYHLAGAAGYAHPVFLTID